MLGIGDDDIQRRHEAILKRSFQNSVTEWHQLERKFGVVIVGVETGGTERSQGQEEQTE